MIHSIKVHAKCQVAIMCYVVLVLSTSVYHCVVHIVRTTSKGLAGALTLNTDEYCSIFLIKYYVCTYEHEYEFSLLII